MSEPMSRETLTDDEWAEIWQESPRYGYCLVEPRQGYRPPPVAAPNQVAELARDQAVVFPTGALTPETKVAALLEAYPELEPVLIAAAPAFNKLSSPVLRRTIARVTSLRRAAEVAGLPVRELVVRLRAAAGRVTATEGITAATARGERQGVRTEGGGRCRLRD